jgi:hypothetical protein
MRHFQSRQLERFESPDQPIRYRSGDSRMADLMVAAYLFVVGCLVGTFAYVIVRMVSAIE